MLLYTVQQIPILQFWQEPWQSQHLIGTDIPLDETTDGVPAVVDGSDGTIYVDPDEETMALMQEKKRR